MPCPAGKPRWGGAGAGRGWAGPAPLFPRAVRALKMAAGRRRGRCAWAGAGRCCGARLAAPPPRHTARKPRRDPRSSPCTIKRGAAGAAGQAACVLLAALKRHRDTWARTEQSGWRPGAEGLNKDHCYCKRECRYVYLERGTAGLK